MHYRNIAHDRYNDGSDITCRATGPVAGKTFVHYSANLTDGLIAVATAPAGGPVAGVAKYDADAGDNLGVARGSARVITVATGAALAAGQGVEVGDGGTAVPADTGNVVGHAVTGAAADTDALVSLIY